MKQTMNRWIRPYSILLRSSCRLCLLLLAIGTPGAWAQDVSAIYGNPDLFPAMGPMMARTTVIEFADFQCPYCAMTTNLPSWIGRYEAQYGPIFGSAEYVQSLAEQNRIRFIYVPLSFLDRGDSHESTWATQAAFCAKNQDLFWEMHHAIFSASDGPDENTGKYSKENLKTIAAGIDGLDTGAFNSCLDNDDTLEMTQQVMDEFYAAGFQLSTPQFWVNDTRVDATKEALQAAIEAQ